MTPAEVYALLHGNVRDFGQARVEAFRAEAEGRLREMRGETGALLRWIAANRERIEKNVTWAEARSVLLSVDEAKEGLVRLVMDALGTHDVQHGDTVHRSVYAPGHVVTLETQERRGYGLGKSLSVIVNIRTDTGKPVYFARVPSDLEKSNGASGYASEFARRAARDKHVLTYLQVAFPVVPGEEFGAGDYDADPQGVPYSTLLQGMPNSSERLASVPALESGEGTVTVTFVNDPPGKGALGRKFRDVPVENLANIIFDVTGVGFPNSPYFKD